MLTISQLRPPLQSVKSESPLRLAKAAFKGGFQMPVCPTDAGTNFSAVPGMANGHQLKSKKMAMSARQLHNRDSDNDDLLLFYIEVYLRDLRRGKCPI